MVAEFNIDITERKKSLEALRQSEEKYRELADTLPQTVFEIDEKGILLYVNSTGIQQFGYQADELGDEVNLSQMLMAEDRDRAMANIKRRLEGGEPENQEYRGIRKDGTVFPINIYSHTVVKDNRVTGLRGVIIDISEQKKAENAIRESETRYRTLFDQASDGIMFMPSDGLTVLVNQSFARMHGYDSPQDMADIDLGKLDAPSSAKLAPERLKRLMDGEKLRFEVEHYHRDGHIFPLRVSVSTVNIGGRLYFLGFHQDITEQRKAESAIKESEAKFRSLAETSPAAIFAYRNKFIYANPACTLLTGYPVSEMLEMNFWEVVHPDHREIVKQRGEARQRGESVPAHYEFKLLRKDGQERWIDFAGTLVDFEGQPAGMGMAIDITERKAMEEILEASEAQYRATLDSFADAIHVVDRDLNIILANETFKKWCRDLNLSDNPIGKNVFEICPFLNNDVRQEYERVFNTCLPLTTQEQNAVAAALIITETRKIPIMENGLATKIITVIRDITKEKEVAYKLAESELKYQQVLEGVAEGIYRTSPEGKILLANQAIVKMLGYSSMEELMARNIEKEGYSDPRYHREFVREMNGKGQVKDWVSEWKRKDGSILVVRENAHVVKDNTGKIIYYEGTVEDITEQRKAEQKLLETERKYYQIFEDIVREYTAALPMANYCWPTQLW
jgi:PAS domain S-box-containing protein